MEKALNVKDFMIVNGVLGTGKILTLCVLLKVLESEGNRVLVSCDSFEKMDTIILRF